MAIIHCISQPPALPNSRQSLTLLCGACPDTLDIKQLKFKLNFMHCQLDEGDIRCKTCVRVYELQNKKR